MEQAFQRIPTPKGGASCYDPSYLARGERAEWPFRQDHLNMLLDFCQVNDGDLRARLVADLAAS
ncbi:hypothetical protein [Micromonospora sp. LOL_023]|uniref:hypothetical protein n=1 Tax=Micromonospora sp. LOL_023 TaxID=3345418 RepID=UPI003A84FCBA